MTPKTPSSPAPRLCKRGHRWSNTYEFSNVSSMQCWKFTDEFIHVWLHYLRWERTSTAIGAGLSRLELYFFQPWVLGYEIKSEEDESRSTPQLSESLLWGNLRLFGLFAFERLKCSSSQLEPGATAIVEIPAAKSAECLNHSTHLNT